MGGGGRAGWHIGGCSAKRNMESQMATVDLKVRGYNVGEQGGSQRPLKSGSTGCLGTPP